MDVWHGFAGGQVDLSPFVPLFVLRCLPAWMPGTALCVVVVSQPGCLARLCGWTDSFGSVFFYRVSSLFVGGGAWASHTPESYPEPYPRAIPRVIPLKKHKKELAITVAFACDPWIAGSYRGFNFK